MTGLKAYEREPDLPALAGDDRLCIPSDTFVAGRIARSLGSGVPLDLRVQLVYARWKPGQSLTCTYEVSFADGGNENDAGGGTEIVVYKRYLGDKAEHVARHFQANAHVEEVDSPLAPFAVLPDEGLCLFRFPSDRVLRGAARVLNKRRLARLVDRSGYFAPRVVRLRPSRIQLLRFKPERRAVFRLDAKLRGPEGPRGSDRVGVRVLPLEHAQRVAERRAALSAGDLVPTLFAWEADTGILLESWLDGRTMRDDEFGESVAAGAACAELHACGAPPAVPASEPGTAARTLAGSVQEELFRVDAELAELGARIALAPPPEPTHWVHGDLHPDQFIARGGARLSLLDLDALRPGAPAEDLASWIADHMAFDADIRFEGAAAPLLEGYATRLPPPDPEALTRCCHAELVDRAAAAIRRLEAGAASKAHRLLRRALELQERGGWSP